MSEFEDNLWRDVVREHGDDLAHQSWPPPRRRRPRPRVLAGTTAALAAAAGALVLLLGGAGSSPAFAVTTNHDGSVTLAITRLDAIHAANAKLTSLGVRAMAVQVPAACGAAISVARFNPRRIPVGKTLVIAAWRAGHQVRLSSARIGPAGSAACLRPGRTWTVIKGPPPITGVPAQCVVSGPPVASPAPVPASGDGGTGTGTTGNTGTTGSTRTQITQGTATAAAAPTQTTGTGTTGTTGNGDHRDRDHRNRHHRRGFKSASADRRDSVRLPAAHPRHPATSSPSHGGGPGGPQEFRQGLLHRHRASAASGDRAESQVHRAEQQAREGARGHGRALPPAGIEVAGYSSWNWPPA